MSPAGRPKAEKPKSNRFSVRLDDETEKKLEIYCKEHNITKGEAIRQGIHLLLQKK
ncbi:CopG family transcriptional regulator [Lachnospiraceae bacterium 48-33]